MNAHVYVVFFQLYYLSRMYVTSTYLTCSSSLCPKCKRAQRVVAETLSSYNRHFLFYWEFFKNYRKYHRKRWKSLQSLFSSLFFIAGHINNWLVEKNWLEMLRLSFSFYIVNYREFGDSLTNLPSSPKQQIMVGHFIKWALEDSAVYIVFMLSGRINLGWILLLEFSQDVIADKQ